MIYYLVATISFFLLFFYNLPNKQAGVWKIQANWLWRKHTYTSLKEDRRFSYRPLQVLNGYKTETNIYMFQTQKSFSLARNLLISLPLNGRGFLTYRKIGKSIAFHSGYGEKLWEKPYKSYPRVSYRGELILHLAGDNNQVMITNSNGNYIGIEKVDGRFLTDFSFPALHVGALILFSGGEIYRIDGKGNLLYKKNDTSKNRIYFYKSSCISPHGSFVAIHYLHGESDYIKILNEKGKRVTRFKLPHIYSHRLYMAISDSGTVLVNLPDQIQIFASDGKAFLRRKKPKKEKIYQIAFYTGKYFIASSAKELIFFHNNGQIIAKRKLFTYPNRIVPSRNTDVAILETPSGFISFQLLK
ncbi:MAG: hypothetical protein AAF518_10915 [Spirochaetota bacterium]